MPIPETPGAGAELLERLERCAESGDCDYGSSQLFRDAATALRRLAADYRFMVDRAADEKLDGYRELGQQCAEALNQRDAARAELTTLRAEVERLREEVAHEAFAKGFQMGGSQERNNHHANEAAAERRGAERALRWAYDDDEHENPIAVYVARGLAALCPAPAGKETT